MFSPTNLFAEVAFTRQLLCASSWLADCMHGMLHHVDASLCAEVYRPCPCIYAH